jgi:PAS domain S-box-containing protein
MEKHVLYVDDEEENLIGFKAVFRKHYTVHIAQDTEKAMDILQKFEIMVLITDQRMTIENGLDFLKRVTPMYPHIVSMVLTAYSDVQNAIQAINQGGIFRYILKPWNKTEMQLAIDSAIETYTLKRENELLFKELKQKNLALKKSEEKFRNIYNTSVDSIFITDTEGKFLDVNLEAINRTGITEEEFNNITIFDLAEENTDQIRECLSNRNPEGFIETSTSYTNPKTGVKVYLETRSKLIDYNNQKAFLHITRDVTERLTQEKVILKTIIETEEKERSRVARELHDGVSPVLAASRLYAQSFASKKDKALEPIILQHLEDTIDEAIQTITEISNNLSPHILQNFGLNIAIENFIEKLKETSGITFSVSGSTTERFPENIETTLYRIVVELINNTIKYANATEVTINIYNDYMVNLIYIDNGVGFDMEDCLKKKTGMGFFNIQSRIRTLSGNFTIKSDINSGVIVNVSIPLNS